MTPQESQQALARASADLQAGRIDAAERAYREVLAQVPDDAAATHYLGVCLVQSGRAAEGLDLVARSLALPGALARYRHNYALMLAQAGRLADAERELAAVVAEAPQDAASWHYLGIVRQQLGRLPEAAAAYRRALDAAPDNAAYAANYGYCLLEQGDRDAAIDWLQRSLAANESNPVAHNTLGSALAAKGDTAAAIERFRRAVALDPRYAKAWYNLGAALADSGDAQGELEAMQQAVRLGPAFAPAWQSFAAALAHARFTSWDGAAAEEITRVLVHADVDPAPLAHVAAELLVLEPRFGAVYAALPSSREPAASWLQGNRLRALAQPLFIALIENALVPDPRFEAFLVALRRTLLDAWSHGSLAGSARLTPIVCALAQQCFLNEYAWPETEAENAHVQRLATRDLAMRSEIEIALLACYRRIADLAALPTPTLPSAEFARIWQRQVTEPRAEARMRERLETLTPIEDAVSQAVARQYEENPYPRWQRLPASLAGAFPVKRVLATLFPALDPAALRIDDAPRILVAGCGTGFQTAVTALRNPGASILAIDLSRASLAYAARRAGELGIANVRFAQADVLRLEGTAERYDWIECTGVLHHLRDPFAGWRVLASLLKPGGVMKVALYSEHARRGIVAARELIGEAGLAPDVAGIRAARELLMSQPEEHPARAALRSTDFYSASGARDLVMHVEEHRYTIAAIERDIARLGLVFLGFEFADPQSKLVYRERFPGDPGMTQLANWAALEEEVPDLFSGMYQFWVASPA